MKIKDDPPEGAQQMKPVTITTGDTTRPIPSTHASRAEHRLANVQNAIEGLSRTMRQSPLFGPVIAAKEQQDEAERMLREQTRQRAEARRRRQQRMDTYEEIAAFGRGLFWLLLCVGVAAVIAVAYGVAAGWLTVGG